MLQVSKTVSSPIGKNIIIYAFARESCKGWISKVRLVIVFTSLSSAIKLDAVRVPAVVVRAGPKVPVVKSI